MIDIQADIIRQRIQGLHERGVFRHVEESAANSGKIIFQFHWLLDQTFSLEFNPVKKQLRINNLLPNVTNRSFMDKDLRQLIADEHNLIYQNRKRSVSLLFPMQEKKIGESLTLLFGVINALFTHIGLYHTDYLHQQLGIPEE